MKTDIQIKFVTNDLLADATWANRFSSFIAIWFNNYKDICRSIFIKIFPNICYDLLKVTMLCCLISKILLVEFKQFIKMMYSQTCVNNYSEQQPPVNNGQPKPGQTKVNSNIH
jgi:hypothetical protein